MQKCFYMKSVRTWGKNNQKQEKLRTMAERNVVYGKSVMLAALAGMALAAPLLGMMGFSFLATLTLLFITSPLLLIFSPLLLFTGLVLMGALVGFGIAATMAFAGVSTLAWMYREIRGSLGVGSRRGQLVPGRYLQQTIQEK